MSRLTASRALDDLATILRDFHGREYSGSIDRETRFFGDLGLASIDAVVLGEELERFYGRSLPFSELLSDLGGRVDRDLSLGELADFLTLHVASETR